MTERPDMRVAFDTEFVDNGRTIDLISIGLVREDGRELYLQNLEIDRRSLPEWHQAHVVPHLRGPTDPCNAHAWVMGERIREFTVDIRPRFWAYYGAYDWVALRQLYGSLLDGPHWWPKHVLDIRQRAVELGNPRLPEKPQNAHDALADAQWNMAALRHLDELATETKMIYTIGTYDSTVANQSKLGRTPTYGGGVAFRTREEAAAYAVTHGEEYRVFGLKCGWSNTWRAPGERIRRIIEDAPIVFLAP